MNDTEKLYKALKAAKEAILWWEDEHPCCAGATSKQMDLINAALEKEGDKS